MPQSLSLRVRSALVAAASVAICAGYLGAWMARVHAQNEPERHAQIGTNTPLPVFVTNPMGPAMLPDGFTGGSRWQFTTWTTPSVLSWTATVNRVAGPWANLTVVAENGVTTTRWYYVPAMPGSWERQ